MLIYLTMDSPGKPGRHPQASRLRRTGLPRPPGRLRPLPLPRAQAHPIPTQRMRTCARVHLKRAGRGVGERPSAFPAPNSARGHAHTHAHDVRVHTPPRVLLPSPPPALSSFRLPCGRRAHSAPRESRSGARRCAEAWGGLGRSASVSHRDSASPVGAPRRNRNSL